MPETRSRAATAMNGAEAAAVPAPQRQKKKPRVNFAAVLPLMMGFAAPLPVLLGATDKVHGETRPASKTPVLYEFNQLFKMCGALFPVVLLLLRLGTKHLFGGSSPKDVSDKFALTVVAVVSAVRALVYFATLMVHDAEDTVKDISAAVKQQRSSTGSELMSDHVFLAISIISLARFELYCCLDTFKSNKMMCVPALLAVLLVALLHANNYITCRYFHTNDESMMALICGILLFELPASVFFWMKQKITA